MYAVIDIETTGGSPKSEKITEIAIFVHDGNKITDEFTSLVNPEKNIPYYITGLTGITNEMVADAPKFYEIAKKIVELTENNIFVAHNSNFDYNFIKNEFKLLGYDFKREQLCTVKLSRKIIPGLRSYSLGKLCSELGISINGRHRAAGDAYATVQLLETLLSLSNYDTNLFNEVAGLSFKGINPSLNTKLIKQLPEKTGIYYFFNENKDIIYIGKSKNIRNRVISHFANKASRRALEMKEQIADISYELTGNELIALLLESDEIKKHRPYYNRSQRRSLFNYGIYFSYDKNGYLNFNIDKNADNDDIPMISFNQKAEAKQLMNELIDRFNLCQKLCGMYKTKGECFHHQIGMCNGACIGKEPPELYNERAKHILNHFSYEHENFLIIDRGRAPEEKSVIRINCGKYMGFGYFDINEFNGDLEIVHDCIKPHVDNRDVHQLIRRYLKNNKVEKIIPY